MENNISEKMVVLLKGKNMLLMNDVNATQQELEKSVPADKAPSAATSYLFQGCPAHLLIHIIFISSYIPTYLHSVQQKMVSEI